MIWWKTSMQVCLHKIGARLLGKLSICIEGDPHCTIDLTSKFCSVASCSASNLQVMFDRRSSRMMELTSILFFILTCSSSRGCRYSGALPALTSASFFSIWVTLSRYSLKCMITALGENYYLKRQ